MGQVFLAEDLQLGRKVAIKIVSERVASDASIISRFAREARLLATVEHPHVVRVYSFGTVVERPYLVMEYVEGISLSDLIRDRGALPVEEALRILRETCEGLEAAQELNIVHRDVKPANILLDRRGRVRVADFGLAKRSASDTAQSHDSALTQSGYFVGSPHYLSPEQAQGEHTDFRSDIYSLGVVLYEMLTGERPFTGSTPIAIVAKHLHDPLPPIESKRHDVPSRLSRLVARMTAKNPDHRPQSYGEIMALTDDVRSGAPDVNATTEQQVPTVEVPYAPGPEAFATVPAAKPKPPRPVGVVALVGAIAIALAALWWWQSHNAKTSAPVMQQAGDGRMVIAITPFYGPDSESEREGRVMAALVERSIASRLDRSEVRVLGIADTKTPVRSHDDARELAKKFGAQVVIWGEAFALRGETEIQPYITVVGLENESQTAPAPASGSEMKMAARGKDMDKLAERDAAVVRVPAEAPNQIELRKMSADGLGQMATFLAGIYALHRKNDPDRALQLFDQAPPSPDLLRQRAQAYLMKKDPERAIALLGEVLAAQPAAAEVRAQLADLLVEQGRIGEAIHHYRALSQAGATPTRNAVFFDGELLLAEVIQSNSLTAGERKSTGNLLVIEPASGRVLRRYPLPGYVERFVPAGSKLTIEYKTRVDDRYANRGTIQYAGGAFDKPLMRGGDLLKRVTSIKAGEIVAANFLDDLSGTLTELPAEPRFRPSRKPKDGNAPKSFADLEGALRAAADKDPTQPWHLFFLGETLRATGRAAEGEAVWRQMFARQYPGVEYPEWGWMAFYFYRLRQTAWGDAAADRAQALRSASIQSIEPSTLIERLINLHYMRLHPAQKFDETFKRSVLNRVRRVSGPVEGDHLVAAAWRDALRARGDARGAAQETAAYNGAVAEPFNMTAACTRVDYALYFAVAVMLTFWFVVMNAFREAIPPTDSTDYVRKVFRAVMTSRYRVALTTLTLTVLAAIVFELLLLSLDSLTIVFFSIIALLLVVTLVTWPWRSEKSWRVAVASITVAHRVLILVIGALVVFAGLAAVHYERRLIAATRLPIGVTDSFGHVDVITDLQKFGGTSPTDESRYALAVAHQLAGDFNKAESLYRSLSGDPRAVRALERVSRRDRHVEMPTDEELLRALMPSWSELLKSDSEDNEDDTTAAYRLLAGAKAVSAAVWVTLLIAFIVIPFAPASAARPRTTVMRILDDLLLPGMRNLRQGRCALGAFQMFAFWSVAIVTTVFFMKTSAVFGAPGVLTAIATPDILSAAPFPSHVFTYVNGNWQWDHWTMMMAHPYAKAFWGTLAVLAVFLVVSHLFAVVASWRALMQLRRARLVTLAHES